MRMELQLLAHCFQDVPKSYKQSLTILHAILKSQCFQQWQKQWTHCINSQGKYLQKI